MTEVESKLLGLAYQASSNLARCTTLYTSDEAFWKSSLLLQAEVPKRFYSSKAEGSNVREGGTLGKTARARAARAPCIAFPAAKNTVH
jgi:hypothetical protein